MRIARTLDWKGERLIQSRLYHDQSPGSIPMDGNATAEASITPQWLPDSPKTGAPCGNRRTSAGGHFLRNHSLFEFVNAERLSDLIVSLLPRVLRQCALASLGQYRSTYQFAMDTITGCGTLNTRPEDTAHAALCNAGLCKEEALGHRGSRRGIWGHDTPQREKLIKAARRRRD